MDRKGSGPALARSFALCRLVRGGRPSACHRLRDRRIAGRPGPRRGPARARAARARPDRAAGTADRARVEGPATTVGPSPPPDVLLPGELPGRPVARLHRPLLTARRRGPRPVQRPRHDPAAGLRRGPDRRRQRPQPVRPPAHGVEGGTRVRGRDANAPDQPATGLGRRRGRLVRRWRSRSSAIRGSMAPASRRPAAACTRAIPGRRPSRSRSRSR